MQKRTCISSSVRRKKTCKSPLWSCPRMTKMANIRKRMDKAGRLLLFSYVRRLLQKRYFLTVVAAASITWTELGPWEPLCGRCYAEKTEAGALGAPRVDDSHRANAPHIGSSTGENRQTSSKFPYVSGGGLYGLLPALLPSLFSSAASGGGAAAHPYMDQVLPSRDYFSKLSELSLHPRLQTVYDFLLHRRRKPDTTTASEKNSSPKTSYSDSTAATALDRVPAPASCSLMQPCNFYGRMLQAVSDLIPRRLFSEGDDDGTEDVGFLSPRRPIKVRRAAEERVDATKVEAETHTVLGAKKVEPKQGEPQAQRTTVTTITADGGPALISDVIDYSLGGARSFGKKRPRNISVWPPSPLPSYEDTLIQARSVSEAFSSSNSLGEEHQHSRQTATVGSSNENDAEHRQHHEEVSEASPQSTEPPLENSDVLGVLPQTIDEAGEGMDPATPGIEPTSAPHFKFPSEDGGSSGTTREPQVKEVRHSPSDKELRNSGNNVHDEIRYEGNSSSSSGENSTTSGNEDSSTSSSIVNGSSTNNSESSSSSGTTTTVAAGAETIKPLGGRKREEQAEQFARQQDTPQDDETYAETPVSSKQLGKDAGFSSPSVRSASSREKRQHGSSVQVTGTDNTDTSPLDTTDNTYATAKKTRRTSRTSAPSTGSDVSMRCITSNMRPQNISGNISEPYTSVNPPMQTTSNSKRDSDRRNLISSRRLEREGSSNIAGAKRLQLPLGALFPTPLSLEQIFKGTIGVTHALNSSADALQRKTQLGSRGRISSSHRHKKRRPAVTLDTLREGGGLGSSFAQAVDASGAIIDVLSASRDLQEAIESVDLTPFGLPDAKLVGDSSSKSRSSWEKLRSAVRAVEEIANWSEAVDHAINTGKHLRESVSNNLRALNLSSSSPPSSSTRRAVEVARTVGKEDSESDTEHHNPVGDWKAAAVAALTAAAQKAERLQNSVRAALNKSENSDNSNSSTSTGSQRQHALNGNNTSIATAAMNAGERARTLLQLQRRGDEQQDFMSQDEDEHHQEHLQQGRGIESLLTRAASVADQLGALLKVSGHQEGSSDCEYVMPLLRELYRVARRLFEVLDISISVADESLDAMQLGKLLRIYEGLIEEGRLTAVGFRSPRVPKRLGQPRVSCANKGMTCCVPAAAAGPDWKQKQQQHLYLQNSPRQECKAVFVSRSSMLCASTPYKNSTCNITHTETGALDKYSVLLPVPAFSAAALCECELSKKRSSEGLQMLEGNAEWTAGEIQADLIEQARRGWQYVKQISSTGNTLAHLLDNTLGKPEPGAKYAAAPRQQQSGPHHQQQTSKRQKQREQQKEQQQQEELGEKAFNGLADVVTKILVNEQLLNLLSSEKPSSAVIPPISVSMRLPKTARLLLPGLHLPSVLAPLSDSEVANSTQ